MSKALALIKRAAVRATLEAVLTKRMMILIDDVEDVESSFLEDFGSACCSSLVL